MSIAEQVQIIRRGLFTEGYDPGEMRQILDNGTQTVVHWARVRPAIVAIGEMPWYDLDQQWQFFLDEERYPVGRPMDLRPDEVGHLRKPDTQPALQNPWFNGNADVGSRGRNFAS